MKRLIEQRYVVRQNILTIIGIGLTVYFAYHVGMGERSRFRLMTLENQTVKIQTEYEAVLGKRQELESRVIKLRPGSIDPDLLEERARSVLGYARPDEHVLILPH